MLSKMCILHVRCADCSEFDTLKQEQDKMRENSEDIENMEGSRSPEGESNSENEEKVIINFEIRFFLCV